MRKKAPGKANRRPREFRKILLITNNHAREIGDSLRNVIAYLRGKRLAVVLDPFSAALADAAPAAREEPLPVAELPGAGAGPGARETAAVADCDLAVAIGGDGTMLRAANLLADYDLPLLGINRGRLGFLADIPADAVPAHLDRILAGEYIEDIRFQLYCEVRRGGETVMTRHAFNDVIAQKGNVAKLVDLDTFVNGDLLHHQRSDGMIVASPTGSTAYALSGGGPILHPALDALVLAPICPHTLSARPIVVDGDSAIKIVVSPQQAARQTDPAKLTCDGETVCDLDGGDAVLVEKKNRRIRLIHPVGHDHFSILRAKLGWG